MNFALSPDLVRRSLSGHSWMGLAIGAAMYLVCLSGTLLVFHDAVVRWKQPVVNEFRDWSPATVQRGTGVAIDRARGRAEPCAG